jgi:polysaccharide biosynthesis protein PslA
MKHQQRINIAWYVFSDFITASCAWACFFIMRKFLLDEPHQLMNVVFIDTKFWLGVLFIPLGWLIFICRVWIIWLILYEIEAK